jgi:hypothetical protein
MSVLQAASMVLENGAFAQTSACEQLKSVLAARIDSSGVRGYSLEAVPAGTPIPRGASVIGSCEAGKNKILYRRWAAAEPAAETAGISGPASAAQPTPMPERQVKRSSGAKGERELQSPQASAPSPATPPPDRRSDSRSDETVSAARLTIQVPEKSVVDSPAPVQAVDAANHSSAPPEDRAMDRVGPATQIQLDVPAAAGVPLAKQASDLAAKYWQWVLAIVLLPVAAGLIWLARARRSAYDEAGLPRGPKL